MAIRRDQLQEVVHTPRAKHVAGATPPNAQRMLLLQISKHTSVGFILLMLLILQKTKTNLPELATLP